MGKINITTKLNEATVTNELSNKHERLNATKIVNVVFYKLFYTHSHINEKQPCLYVQDENGL